MMRETQRRLALLAVVGVVATGWAAAFNGTGGVTPVASAAAATPPRTTVARITVTSCPFPTALRGAFEIASDDASIPPAMLWAVAKVESNLHEDAQSAAGARGLLQVMPETARSLDLNVDEPSSNILAGARYLRLMLDRFHSSDLALAAYNAGPTAVAEVGEAPNAMAVAYVENVKRVWSRDLLAVTNSC